MSGSHWMMDGGAVGGRKRESETGGGRRRPQLTLGSSFLSFPASSFSFITHLAWGLFNVAWHDGGRGRDRPDQARHGTGRTLGSGKNKRERVCACAVAGRGASFRRQQMMSDGARNGRSQSRGNYGDSPLITRRTERERKSE